MNFNLLTEKWIPVLRQNQKLDWISPSQVGEEDILGLHFPRPDFNGSLAQFLIGLLQTYFTPETEKKWKIRFDNPPDTDTLAGVWKHEFHAFNLLGEGPRFMQSYEELEAEPKPVSALFVDSPGENTLKENKDFFIKRGRVERLSLSMAAAALICLQMNAPSGGAGHRTSLRGGGPLTTLLEGKNLWQTLWFNIFPTKEFEGRMDYCNLDLTEISHKFPWMGATRISKSGMKTEITDPQNAHPLHVYWSMPRRIRIKLNSTPGICSLLGVQSDFGIQEYVTESYGFNYKGVWKHPLSPYYYDKDRAPLCIHPGNQGITYRHWAEYVMEISDKEGREARSPAAIVAYARKKRRLEKPTCGLWAFGYEMDNAKAVSWQESHVPSWHLPEDEEFYTWIRDGIIALVDTAEMAASILKKAVKEASSGSPDTTALVFYQETESEFYSHLNRIFGLESGGNLDEIKQRWLKYLRRKSERLFDEFSANFDITQGNMKKISLARKELMGKLYSKKILPEKLGLILEKGA